MIMRVEVPISIGELFDKISILKIKQEKINDTKMLDHINLELSLLNKCLHLVILENKKDDNEVETMINQLKKINAELWEIEDQKRSCEEKKIFDQNFINLARSVYLKNDERAELKKQINLKFNSKIVEVKNYKKY